MSLSLFGFANYISPKQVNFLSERKLLKVFTVMDAIDCPSAADMFGLWSVVLRLSA